MVFSRSLVRNVARKSGTFTISGYRLEEKLAIGGSGTVFRAVRTADGENVAFKLMHSELEEQAAERRRFSREAEIVRSLVHPHIVRLLDYGHSEHNVPYLVFPLLKGQTLHEHIKEHGPFSPMETGRLSLQVLSALEKAHEVDIAHRDIKPANLFLIDNRAELDVRLLDFGLAKLIRGDKRVDITRQGALIGTPRYMAPEQVRAEPIGMAADIYSFGLVMAEMLTGRAVVDAEGELDIYMAHGSDRPLDIPKEIINAPFGSVIRRALAKPLEVRYQKASQMHADVKAVMELLEVVGDKVELAQPDLESTQVIHSSEVEALRKRHNSKASKKLRDAFNRLADKAAAEKGKGKKMPERAFAKRVPQPPNTIPMREDEDEEVPSSIPMPPVPDHPPTPPPLESMPILLTRAKDDFEEDTLRIKKKNKGNKKS